jgi:BirA family biotin operon repressor/biotin-[acetyl-CoA-carboxylase] ligase
LKKTTYHISERSDYQLIELLTIDSTNNYAATIAPEQLVSEFTVIMAYNQTNGKGQRGNNWETEAGENLTVSVITSNLGVRIDEQFVISMVVALSIHDLLTLHIKAPVFVKWPNDIYVNENKIGGILIENSISQAAINKSIIGLGLNVNQTNFPSVLKATSMKNETGKPVALLDILDQWMICLKSRLSNLNFMEVKADYLNKLLGRGISEQYIYKDNIIEATITDVNKQGKLVLITAGGKRIESDLKEITRL